VSTSASIPRSPLDAWRDRAAGLIHRRVEDAGLHERVGNVAVAADRLDELAAQLWALLKDARADFYHRAFASHRRAGLVPTTHRTDMGPTAEGEDAARNARVHGRHAGRDLAALTREASDDLRAISMISADDGTAGSLRELWLQTHRDRLERAMARELGDSETALHHAVGRVLLKAEARA
jgi:hypothetical protein